MQMTLQDIGKITLGVLLLIGGVALNALSFLAIFSLEKAIFYANLAILNGESLTSFIRPIAALLSGGYLKVIDTQFVYWLIILAWVLIWLGIQTIIFTLKRIPLKFILSKKFWSVIDLEVIHNRKYRDQDLPWLSMKKKAKRKRK